MPRIAPDPPPPPRYPASVSTPHARVSAPGSLANALAALPRPPAGARVCVVLPDATRPLDPALALPPVLDWLGAPPAAVLIGLGLHRAPTPAERARVPFADAQPHDPDDTAPLPDAPWPGGPPIPGGVARPVAAADLTLSLGVLEVHQYAGLSGGHKGVAVGCGARATIAALHARARVLHPGVRLGALAGNPFRAAIDALGAAARCRIALGLLPDGRWLGGDPAALLPAALPLLAPFVPTDRTYAAAVLRVPTAKASSAYQASRAATYLGLSPAPPLPAGAPLYVEAACPEGLGAEAGFVRALASCPPPWSALLDGPEPTGPGAQRAVILALLARRHPLVFCAVDDPAPLRAVGLTATRAPAPRGPDVLVVDAPFHRIPQAASAPA